MKICFVITALGYGGAEVLLKNLCNHLAGEHELHVLHLKPLDDLASQFDSRVHRVSLGLDQGTPNRIRSYIRAIQPDVINTHLGHADLLTMWALRRRKHLMVLTLHNVFYTKTWRDRVYFQLYRLGLHRLHPHAHLTGVSPATVRHATRVYRLPKYRRHYIPNAIPENFPKPDPVACREGLQIDHQTFVVLFVGRLSKQKAVYRLIEAIAQLKQEGSHGNMVVMLLGEGELRPALETLCRHRQVTQQVHFCGTSPHPERYMAAADVLVLPSLFEGLPTVVLEAFRQHLPVIASRVDGNKDLIQNEENGLLFDPEQEGALAACMLRLRNHPALRSRLAQAAYESFRTDYTIKRYAEHLLGLFRQMIDSKV